jgi:hypothetical protein
MDSLAMVLEWRLVRLKIGGCDPAAVTVVLAPQSG